MRILNVTLVSVAAALAWSTAAGAADVKKEVEVPGKPAEVWAKVGGFCAIKDWHPAVAECEEMKDGDDTYRILTLGDGAKIKEKLTDKGDSSYSYDIIESPLPVDNYKAKFKVEDDDDGTEITWKAKFDAKGVEEEEAEKVISGIFDAGLKSIKESAGSQ